VNSFKDHYRKFNKNGERVTKRHEGIILPPSIDAKHAGDVVPVSHRANNNTVQEFESLKKLSRGTKVVNQAKASKLKQQFNLKDYTGKLGNTGISIQPHQTSGLYILQK
jgi:hypothetical protein